jgi:hypothetical protein
MWVYDTVSNFAYFVTFLTLLALSVYVGHGMWFTQTMYALITVWSVGTVFGSVSS